MYLPVYYQNGNTYPAGQLFILKENGDIWHNAPDSNRVAEIELLRVYPVRHYQMSEYSLKLCHGTFEGSNDFDFASTDTLYQIPSGIDQYPPYDPDLKGRYIYSWWWQDIVISPNKTYRYIRFKAPMENPCGMGEMEVFDRNGTKLTGIRNFGFGDSPDHLTDGVPGNTITFETPGEWAAVDLGRAFHISAIRYIPRDVGPASIKAGDTYTLFYWDNEWRPLYETIPEIKSVKITVHPKGLYLLQNTTTNNPARPFIYSPETEMVEWW